MQKLIGFFRRPQIPACESKIGIHHEAPTDARGLTRLLGLRTVHVSFGAGVTSERDASGEPAPPALFATVLPAALPVAYALCPLPFSGPSCRLNGAC